ncbi:MAG: dihydrofolate reductase family protein [Thermocrispum sp.]
MSRVIADISMSLDGFVAGPHDHAGQGLGKGGEILHHWVFGRRWTYGDHSYDDAATGVDEEVLDEVFGSAGAIIVGRGMFEAGGGWGDTNPFPIPCFVLTHRPEDLRDKAPTFRYVCDGIDSALAQARAVAGRKNVVLGGGADVIRQFFAAGLVDGLSIHLAPVVLGGGKRLFQPFDTAPVELEQTRQQLSPFTTHLRYNVIK